MGIHQSRLVGLGRFKNAAPRLFSSSSSSSAAVMVRRPGTHLTLDDNDSGSESPVYRRALKLQRPTTVKYYNHNRSLHNSVSFIGTIEDPLKESNNAGARFGVRTRLKVVRRLPGACHTLWLLLNFWGEIAEMSVQHLKPRDLIYVSGHLGSYVKVDDGKPMRFYKVNVTEVNFVAQECLGPACQSTIKLESKVSVEEMKQRRRIRLHLWQVFFANPSEWWDNRNSKRKLSAPDFKHKDTGEALWLQENDPPWIRKQLQLHDSRSGKQGPREFRNSLSYLSPLVYKDVSGT